MLTNPAMPGLVKIGCTGRSPAVRARELTASTGVPAPFVVAWAAPVIDHAATEKLVHARLDRLRSNASREFFRCDVATARVEVLAAASALLRPWWWRLLHGWTLRPGRSRRHSPRRRRRGSADGLAVGLLVAGVFGLVVWLKPAPPSFLPLRVARAVLLLEGLR